MNIDFKTYHQFDNKFDGKKKCPHECYSSGVCPFNISEEKIPCAEEYPYADCYYNFSSAGQYVVFENVFDNIQVMKVNDNEATTVSSQSKFKISITEPGEYRIRWYTKSNIINPSNKWSFYYVDKLASIDLSRLSITVLPKEVFINNKALKNVIGLDSIEEFSYGCFSHCNLIENTISLKNAKIFRENSFTDCTNIKMFIIGDKCEYIEYHAFAGGAKERVYIFHGKVPPVMAGDAFQFNVSPTIYVPIESLNLYKTATGWTAWASRIFPMAT